MPNEIITEAFNEKISLWNSIERIFGIEHDPDFANVQITPESNPREKNFIGKILYYPEKRDWEFLSSNISYYANFLDIKFLMLMNYVLQGSCAEQLDKKDGINIGNIIRKKFRDSLIDQVR